MNWKRMKFLALAVLMLCSVVLSACQTETPVQSNKANYKVSILAPDGTPMTTGVAVKFMQNGERVAMQGINVGDSAVKELAKDDYQVELMFTSNGDKYEYEMTDLTLSATKTELTIQLYYTMPTEKINLNVPVAAPGDDPTVVETVQEARDCYYVELGKTKVVTTPGTRNFFIFTPEVGGIYEFSFNGEMKAIGIYGTPFYVQYFSTATPSEESSKACTFNIRHSDVGNNITGTSQLVIGIDASAQTESGVLEVKRLGDPAYIMPYTAYQGTFEMKPYVHPEGAVTTDFDMSQKYNIVYNEEDGYFHVDSVDGPLVLLRIGSKADDQCKFLLNSIESVMMYEPFLRTYFNDAGEEVKKVNFDPCLGEYLEKTSDEVGAPYKYVDNATGLYPMTKDLQYILMERAEWRGWFDPSHANYIFYDESDMKQTVDPETAWLFNCCYIA